MTINRDKLIELLELPKDGSVTTQMIIDALATLPMEERAKIKAMCSETAAEESVKKVTIARVEKLKNKCLSYMYLRTACVNMAFMDFLVAMIFYGCYCCYKVEFAKLAFNTIGMFGLVITGIAVGVHIAVNKCIRRYHKQLEEFERMN